MKELYNGEQNFKKNFFHKRKSITYIKVDSKNAILLIFLTIKIKYKIKIQIIGIIYHSICYRETRKSQKNKAEP